VFSGPDALYDEPCFSEWNFRRSSDGKAVAILEDEKPMALVMFGNRRGHLRHFVREGPWDAAL
jgi:hypothetical protein